MRITFGFEMLHHCSGLDVTKSFRKKSMFYTFYTFLLEKTSYSNGQQTPKKYRAGNEYHNSWALMNRKKLLLLCDWQGSIHLYISCINSHNKNVMLHYSLTDKLLFLYDLIFFFFCKSDKCRILPFNDNGIHNTRESSFHWSKLNVRREK